MWVVGCLRYAPAASERFGNLTRGWVAPRVGIDGPPLGMAPRAAHPVASHYTDQAIPAHSLLVLELKACFISQ